jgi:hypothetical protein
MIHKKKKKKSIKKIYNKKKIIPTINGSIWQFKTINTRLSLNHWR